MQISSISKPLPTQITVIGSGSWATAIIKILSENNVKIMWWLRTKKDADYVKKYYHNPRYLTDVQLNPRKVKTTTSIQTALKSAEYVIFAMPSAFLLETIKPLNKQHFEGKKIVSAIKGMLPEKNVLITDYIKKQFGISPNNICVVAGPCHAEEVALEKQSYVTIASPNYLLAQHFASLMKCRYVNANSIVDLDGVEYCAIMKNIIAIASGICHGLGYGDNFQAVLVSNAMEEIKLFTDAIAPTTRREMYGSGYLGDLLVTSYSKFSRNRSFGNMVGRGYSIKSAQIEMNMIAEGYYAVKSIFEVNKVLNQNLPIISAVYRILYEKAKPDLEISELKNKLK
jgi:glycerol-3-phosphate dehydrogenase (NAD(P)+)